MRPQTHSIRTDGGKDRSVTGSFISGRVSSTRSVFITNNGLSDHIGVSQVLPYLEGLLTCGHRVECIAVENRANRAAFNQGLQDRIETAGVRHFQVKRSPPFMHKIDRLFMPNRISRLLDSRIREFGPDLIHCRSYMPLSAVLRANDRYKIPFIFDMRGFWIDERIESGIWSLDNPFWRRVVKRFRSLEASAMNQADNIVVLTEDAKQKVLSNEDYGGASIDVIPCSVDQETFSIEEDLDGTRRGLGFTSEDMVLVYLGSSGPLYKTELIYKIYSELKRLGASVKILFIGEHDSADHVAKAKEAGVELSAQDIVCKRVAHADVPHLLNAGDFGLSFRIQSVSSLGASPTKVGEYLSCGLPVISNDGVGDIRRIIKNGQNGVVLDDFTEESFRDCAQTMCEGTFLPREQIRKTASPMFDMNHAIESYDRIYQRFGTTEPKAV